jgi:hypothetical protein
MSQLAQDAPKSELVAAHVDSMTRDELVALARQEDRSVASIVRRALAAYLDEHTHTQRRRRDMSDVTGFIDVPSGRRLEESRTTIRVLPRASDKALASARRTWPQSDAADFDRDGKLFRDKATGVAYRRVPGDPQAGGGRGDIATWFISADDWGDGIVYLQRADDPGSVVTQDVGEIGGRRETAQDVMR